VLPRLTRPGVTLAAVVVDDSGSSVAVVVVVAEGGGGRVVADPSIMIVAGSFITGSSFVIVFPLYTFISAYSYNDIPSFMFSTGR